VKFDYRMTVLAEKNCRPNRKSIVPEVVWRDHAHFGEIMTQPAVSKLRILQASSSDVSGPNCFLTQQNFCDNWIGVPEETCFEEGYAVG
jgi:hypothetical protein